MFEIKLKPQHDKLELIKSLINRYTNWKFKNLGSIKRYPDSIHYSITSLNKEDMGIIEIKFDIKRRDILLLNIKLNGEWAENALKDITNYLH